MYDCISTATPHRSGRALGILDPWREVSTGLWVRSDRPGPRRSVLHVRGEVDAYTAPALLAALRDDAPGATSLDVDLSEVTLLCSAGIRALLDATRSRGSLGCTVQIVNPSRAARVTLGALGLIESAHQTASGEYSRARRPPASSRLELTSSFR